MSTRKYKIAHLTSVHPRYDTRIFYKECCALGRRGYEVNLIVADGKGDEKKCDIVIHDMGKPRNRIDRMLRVTRKIYKYAKKLDADIYHFHDPELIGVGSRLRNLGKTVIFDVHEDIPKQLLSKPYLSKILKVLLSKIYSYYEVVKSSRFDAIIAATPFIQNKFMTVNSNVINVNNYPILDELTSAKKWHEKSSSVAYIGGITSIRGIREIILALGHIGKVRLNLAGSFSEPEFEAEVKAYPSWNNVNELGYLNREGVAEILSDSMAGIVTLHPAINYLDALPVKMFEYMSAGLPVIASNFPLWREIVEGARCGLCVDPLNPKSIAEAIEYLIFNPVEAETMGKNGRNAVIEKYNWAIEEIKLLRLYKSLLEDRSDFLAIEKLYE